MVGKVELPQRSGINRTLHQVDMTLSSIFEVSFYKPSGKWLEKNLKLKCILTNIGHKYLSEEKYKSHKQKKKLCYLHKK